MIPPDTTIVITSDEPYSKMWHTQLIYTEYLAGNNHVIYMDPPGRWKFSNLFDFKLTARKINEHLTIVQSKNILPASIPVFHAINEQLNQKIISGYLQKLNCKSLLIWHFDSYRNGFGGERFKNKFFIKRIYHVIDPFYKNPINKLLCGLADLIVITSSRNNKFYSDHQQKVINIPQCIDLKLNQSQLKAQLSDSFPLSQPFAVLLGTFSNDIDYAWLHKLVQQLNGLNFVLMGNIVLTGQNRPVFEQILGMPNVHHAGVLGPSEFYPIIKNAAIGFVMYNESRRNKVCSPLKTINYLVAGIPTVTNIDCEIPELLNKCIFYGDTFESYKEKINDLLHKKISFQTEKAIEYLQTISLEIAVEKILSEVYKEKVLKENA